MLIKDAKVPLAALSLAHLVSVFDFIEDLGHNTGNETLININNITVGEFRKLLNTELEKC